MRPLNSDQDRRVVVRLQPCHEGNESKEASNLMQLGMLDRSAITSEKDSVDQWYHPGRAKVFLSVYTCYLTF